MESDLFTTIAQPPLNISLLHIVALLVKASLHCTQYQSDSKSQKPSGRTQISETFTEVKASVYGWKELVPLPAEARDQEFMCKKTTNSVGYNILPLI